MRAYMLRKRMILGLVIPCVFALIGVSVVSGPKEAWADQDPVSSVEARMYQSILEKVSKTKIHGFLSQGFLWSVDNNYLATDSSTGDFRFNELGINFTFPIQKKLRVGLQIFSRSFGSIGNNEVRLDWAFADYRFRDWLGFRAGKMKTPMGLYNETRDIDALRAGIFLPECVYSEFERDFTSGVLGFGIYGEVLTVWDSSLSYQLQFGTLTVPNEETIFKSTIEKYGIESSATEMDKVVAASLIWNTPYDWLRIGSSLMWWESISTQCVLTSSNPLAFIFPGGTPLLLVGNDYIIWVASIEAVWDPITFSVEFKQTNSDVTFHIELPGGGTFPLPYNLYQQGYYASLSYRMADSWELGLCYSMYWDDANNRKGNSNAGGSLLNQVRLAGRVAHEAWQRDLTLSIRHDIFENWLVKLEGHYMNGSALGYASGSAVYPVEDWFIGAVKTSFAF